MKASQSCLLDESSAWAGSGWQRYAGQMVSDEAGKAERNPRDA